MAINFDIKESKNKVIIKIKGRLNRHTSPILEQAVAELIKQGKQRIMINLEKVSHVDRAGKILLRRLLTKVNKENCRIVGRHKRA